MFKEWIIKIHNMSLFPSPWCPGKMSVYMVCETSNGRKLMVLFKELDNQIQINLSYGIKDCWYCVFPDNPKEIQLILEGHCVNEVFTIFDLDTGEELNGKN